MGTYRHYWKPAMNQFAILYPDRFVPANTSAWTLPEPWTHKNAPTAPWKTAQNAVSHERPHAPSFHSGEEEKIERVNLLHTQNS